MTRQFLMVRSPGGSGGVRARPRPGVTGSENWSRTAPARASRNRVLSAGFYINIRFHPRREAVTCSSDRLAGLHPEGSASAQPSRPPAGRTEARLQGIDCAGRASPRAPRGVPGRWTERSIRGGSADLVFSPHAAHEQLGCGACHHTTFEDFRTNAASWRPGSPAAVRSLTRLSFCDKL